MTQHRENYHHLSPFWSPLRGSRICFPSPLAIGPSTTYFQWGFHALCCSSGLPSTPATSRYCFSPTYLAFGTASQSLSMVRFLELPFSRRLGTRFVVSDYDGCVSLSFLEV